MGGGGGVTESGPVKTELEAIKCNLLGNYTQKHKLGWVVAAAAAINLMLRFPQKRRGHSWLIRSLPLSDFILVLPPSLMISAHFNQLLSSL